MRGGGGRTHGLLRLCARCRQEQLALRAAPDKWPIWALRVISRVRGGRREHTTWSGGARVRPRIVRKIVERCLEQWTLSMLGDEYVREIRGKTQKHTRQSVLMRLITHDAYHT